MQDPRSEPWRAESAGQIAMRLVRDQVDETRRFRKAEAERLATAGGVGATSIYRAVVIKRWAPDLVESVVDGRLELYRAAPLALARRPKGASRTTASRRMREVRIRQMAEDGYSEDDIAAATGLVLTSVRASLRQLGLESLARRLHVVRRLDYDAVMERMVTAAEPSLDAIAALDLAALNPARLAEWQSRLTAAIREWTHLRNQLRRVQRAS